MSTQRLTTADLHWAAGFLEGEGTFGWNPTAPALQARAAQKDVHCLEKLKQLFGGTVFHLKRTPGKGAFGGDIWWWCTTSARAAAVMMTLYTLFSPRRQKQITTALTAWKAYPMRRRRRQYKEFY